MAGKDDLGNNAIESAANYLTTKVEKRHKKHSKQGTAGYSKLKEECHCDEEKLEIEEGKKSPLIRSPVANRKVMRRDGVAQKSEVEPKLLKEALETIAKYEVTSNILTGSGGASNSKRMATRITSDDMATDALESAANYLTIKVEKRHKKHSKEEKHPKQGGDGYVKLVEECHCEEEKQEIEEGKKSPLMRSPVANRKAMRRDGVAEKNEIESKLLKETVAVITKTHNMVEFNL